MVICPVCGNGTFVNLTATDLECGSCGQQYRVRWERRGVNIERRRRYFAAVVESAGQG